MTFTLPFKEVSFPPSFSSVRWLSHTHTHTRTHARTHARTHTNVVFYGLRGLSICVRVQYCTNYMCYCPTPTLHLNLALTGDGAFLFSPQKTHSVWFINVLNCGDTENVLINHLLLIIPAYPCHYTHLCPHIPQNNAIYVDILWISGLSGGFIGEFLQFCCCLFSCWWSDKDTDCTCCVDCILKWFALFEL